MSADNDDGRSVLEAIYGLTLRLGEALAVARALPLRALQAALFELDKGGEPPAMLAPATARGRPKRSLDEGALVLAAAVAMEAASRTRVPQPAARVADLLRARGYTNGEKEITAATVTNWRARLNEGPGGVMEDALCDLWRWIKAQMDADPSHAARGPEWFVNRLPDILLDTGAGFRKKPPA
jgi:hypothetical protein